MHPTLQRTIWIQGYDFLLECKHSFQQLIPPLNTQVAFVANAVPGIIQRPDGLDFQSSQWPSGVFLSVSSTKKRLDINISHGSLSMPSGDGVEKSDELHQRTLQPGQR